MNGVRVRAAVAVALMMVALAGAYAWRPTVRLSDSRPKVQLESMFPKQFADWRLDDQAPVQLIAPDVAAVLNSIYSQTLSRTYVNREGSRIMLSVAYGGDQSDATRAHRPEVCYPAQGFQILESRDAGLALPHGRLPVRRVIAKLGPRVEPITYWVVVGERITVSGTEQKLAQLAYSTRGVIPDGILVRISNIDSDANEAYELQARFVAALATALAHGDKARVFGAVGAG